jgi:hypothetical protein
MRVTISAERLYKLIEPIMEDGFTFEVTLVENEDPVGVGAHDRIKYKTSYEVETTTAQDEEALNDSRLIAAAVHSAIQKERSRIVKEEADKIIKQAEKEGAPV